MLYTKDFTSTFVPLGVSSDDPTVVADYDGDGKDDPAVYHCPVSTPGYCTFSYIGSLSNPQQTVTSQVWGFGTIFDFAAVPGYFDSDNKADFCVYMKDPGSPNRGMFAILNSSNGTNDNIVWGLMTDSIVPGDFDGDGRTDFMVVRNENGYLVHYLLTATGNVSAYTWGITGDIVTPGDYNGDGKDDIAVYRPSAVPLQSIFWVYYPDSNTYTGTAWGQASSGLPDVPAASWQVH